MCPCAFDESSLSIGRVEFKIWRSVGIRYRVIIWYLSLDVVCCSIIYDLFVYFCLNVLSIRIDNFASGDTINKEYDTIQ